MLDTFLETLPFFGVIWLGWLAARTGFFSEQGAAWLTRFVFYFALPAMLFRFASGLDMATLFEPRFAIAYLTGSLLVWAIGMVVARWRSLPLPEAAMEAHCTMTGNTGFLGVPLLAILLGERAIGPIMTVLAIDMLIFSTLVTLIIHASRSGGLRARNIAPILRGIVANPMILSMAAGLIWAQIELPVSGPFDDFLMLMGNAATPCALFVIGAGLAARQAKRVAASGWLSFAKLVLHPAAVGGAAFLLGVQPFDAGVMIAAAALPVAGNVYILAQYFNVAQQRVSAAILISTIASILTLPVAIMLITQP